MNTRNPVVGKIPATIITGFLGAGKTTLIRNLLQSAYGKQIALIVNEFGDMDFDGDLLKSCGDETCNGDDIIELNNGCICCTVADDFVPTISRILQRDIRPDHIVIETSGLALPQPLLRAFNWPDICENVSVDGVIGVVDTHALAQGRYAMDVEKVDAQRLADTSLDHESSLEELFEDQLTCADMIILNKCDLVDKQSFAKVSTDIKRRVKSGVNIVRASNGLVPPQIILGLECSSQDDIENRKARQERQDENLPGYDDDHNHSHSEFANFVADAGQIGNIEKFKYELQAIIKAQNILRLKGFVWVKDKAMRLVVQAVGSRIDTYFDRDWTSSEEPATRLVVIGHENLDQDNINASIRLAAEQAG